MRQTRVQAWVQALPVPEKTLVHVRLAGYAPPDADSTLRELTKAADDTIERLVAAAGSGAAIEEACHAAVRLCVVISADNRPIGVLTANQVADIAAAVVTSTARVSYCKCPQAIATSVAVGKDAITPARLTQISAARIA